MLNKFTFLLFLIGAILFSACVDVISFETPESNDLLVVDGRITNTPGPQRISLKQLTPYGKRTENFVTGAEITLISDAGLSEEYQEMEEGVYEIPAGKVNPVEGEAYHIEITLANGEKYLSTPEIMPPLFSVDSIYFALEMETVTSDIGLIIEQRVINIYLDTPIKKGGKAAKFRWTADDAFMFIEIKCSPMHAPRTCYFFKETNPQEIHLFDATDLQSSQLIGHKVVTESFFPTYAYDSRHYFNIAQHSITDEAYEYWQQLNQVSNLNGSIFDPPPAAVRGNIYKASDPNQYVLGYFEATAIDTARVFTLPIYFQEFRQVPRCPPDHNFLVDPIDFPWDCCNCILLQEGGTYQRPAYWGN